MSWNIQKPGDYLNGPLTVMGNVAVGLASATSRLHVVGGSFQNPLILDTLGYNQLVFRLNGTDRGQLFADATYCFGVVNSANSAYRMLVSDSGNVGISTAPFANGRLAVSGATSISASNYIGASTWAARFIGNSNGAASGISLLSYSASGLETPASLHVVPIADYRSALIATFSADASGAGYFAVNQFVPTSSSTLERFRVNRNGAVVLGGGTVDANGTGIAFPAAQSASTDANTLDDYEEGTFTPTITASTGTPTTTTINSATYTKIGRLVSVTVDISIVNIGTASNLLQFTLPFSQGTDNNIGSLREVGATAYMGQFGSLGGSAAFAALYNNATVWVNGYRIRGTYTYTV